MFRWQRLGRECGITLGCIGVLVMAQLPGAAFGAASVRPSDMDGAGGVTKPASRDRIPIAGTDVQNLDTSEFFATIQDALDDTDTQNGHVLEVQVASHAEGIVLVHKGVTIRGGLGGATLTATTDTGTSGGARGWFRVTATGVTFRDLAFDGTGHSIYQAVRIEAAGALVEGCDFAHMTALPLSSYDGRGVAATANVTVQDCTFSDIRRIGVHLFGPAVTSALVSRCTYTGKGAGDQLDYGVELGGGAVAQVENNTITACTGVALVDGSGSGAVLVTDFFGPGTAGSLAHNRLNGNSTAIVAGFLATDVSVVVAHDNDLSGNTDGIANTNPGRTVDASANWWGSNAAATVAAAAGVAVDYTPWLHAGTDTDVAPGFQGDFSTLDVDDDSPQVGGTNRVQEGVDLVSGSTVYVLPGTYVGLVDITTTLDLLGPNAGFDARAARPNPEAILDGGLVDAAVRIAANDVVVDGFTITRGQNGLNAGITMSSTHAGAQVLDNIVTDNTIGIYANCNGGSTIRHNKFDANNLPGPAGGSAIYSESTNGLVVDENEFANHSTNTPVIFGAAGPGAHVGLLFTDNSLHDNVSGVLALAMSGGVFSGNTVTTSPAATGITLAGGCSLVDVLSNTLVGNARGLRLADFFAFGANTDAEAHQNVFGSNTEFAIGILAGGHVGTLNATCNWYGHIDGPDVPPGNPNPLAPAIVGSTTYAPWLAGVPPAACDQFGANQVAAVADTCISSVHTCETADVVFTRADATPMRGYSIRFHLSPNLALCDVPATSITKGPYLTSGAGLNGTVYQVVSNGGNSYTVDEAILGTPCGATGSGVLFRVRVRSSGGDGVGTITVDSVTARDCTNAPIAGIPGAPASIGIDNTPPAAMPDLVAAQIRTGNDADGTTKIRLTFTPPASAAAVQVYRAGFGNYPEYDDPPGPGSVPATPGYPPPSPWALTGVTASGQTDEVATRDFWYFVAFAVDSCGNVSPVSNQTTGTLNYHLGDVHNGSTNCAGNNLVNTSDISFLGANYAITLAPSSPLACLDIGPTTDNFVHGRPTTDNRVQFEDLILFAINFGDVSKAVVHPAPMPRDEIAVLLPEGGAAPGRGDLLARIWMRGSGRVQGLSVQLGWNPAAVQPAGIDPGDLVRDQQGVAFGAGPGSVDAALLGARDVGLAGEGVLATVRFRVVGPGDPNITVASVDARDVRNERIEVRGDGRRDGAAAPRVTQLLPNVPNPFNPSTRVAFTLAEPGRVDVGIYSVDGRRVRVLLAEMRGAGLHEVVWDGTDDAGHRLASGAYWVRLATGSATQSRPVVMLK